MGFKLIKSIPFFCLLKFVTSCTLNYSFTVAMGLYRESNRSIESQKDSTSTTNVDKMTVNSPRKTDVGYVVGGNRPGRGVHLKLIEA